jgi:copper ion binding protein
MCKTCGCHGGNLTQQELKVIGMSCDHCKNAVEKAVRGLPGVLAAQVDLTAGTVRVEYDPAKSSLDDIKQAIVDAGYEVAA